MRMERTNTSPVAQWWRTMDRVTLLTVAIIAAIGLVLVMAASPAVASHLGRQPFHFVKAQVVFLTAGAAIIVCFSTMPVVVIRRIAVLGFVASVILLVAVLVFGAERNGAKRWLSIAGFALQPSEFARPLFAVVTAWVLARRNMVEGYPGFRIALALYALMVALLVLQPNFSMVIAVSLVWGAQMFLAGLPLVWAFGILGVGVAGSVAAYMIFPHVAHRINTFLDPASGDNYQVAKAREAIIHGGFTGVGPGQGVVKQHVPDAHTDFIFAVAGEELGTLVCMGMAALFACVVLRGFYRVSRESNLFIVYAASGLLIQFGMQALVNMGVALSLLPNTGMTLPFVSYGGSSTLAISMAMGMILAFTRKRYGEAG